MSAEQEVKFILDSIHENLADMHTLQMHEQLKMDTKCQAEVVTALLVAEDSIKAAAIAGDERDKQEESQRDPNTRSTISKPVSEDPE